MNAAATLLLGLAAVGASASELRFTTPTVLPGIGLQLRVMPHVTEQPLPPETIYPYLMRYGDREEKVEMFSPYDLWRRSQQAAQWRDAAGNRLTLAVITHALPAFTNQPHVLRRDFEAAFAGAAKKPDAWTSEDLLQWTRDFAPGARLDPARDGRRLEQFAELRRFASQDDPRRLAFAFRFRARSAANWFFALIELGPDTDPTSAPRIVERQFLPYLVPAAQPPPPAPPTPPGTIEKTDSRREVAASIANLKNWWFAETTNYIILSDLHEKNRRLVADLQANIETLRAGFEHVIPPEAPISAVSVIRVFNTPEEYFAYIGPNRQWTSGLWQPDRQELVIRPSADSDGPEKLRGATRSIYHEAFHQYLFYALDRLSASPWFNEGFATLCEDADVRHGRIVLGEDPEKLDSMLKMIASNRDDISRILNLSYTAFYDVAKEQRTENYVLSWALAYYLRRACGPDAEPRYAGIPSRYVEALLRTEDAAQATREAFADIDMARLQRDMENFWQSPHRRAAARRRDIFSSEEK